MQEEVNEKTISLCIKGGKITAQILKAALIKLLAEMDKKKQRGKGEKSQCKKTGRQSIKSLQKSGAQITNIVVTDNNIKSFDRVARKYGIENQKELIQRYISCKESLQNVPVMDFVDDGYTGSNFDRPGFQQMMDGVRNGKIDTIIVKDLWTMSASVRQSLNFGRDWL